MGEAKSPRLIEAIPTFRCIPTFSDALLRGLTMLCHRKSTSAHGLRHAPTGSIASAFSSFASDRANAPETKVGSGGRNTYVVSTSQQISFSLEQTSCGESTLPTLPVSHCDFLSRYSRPDTSLCHLASSDTSSDLAHEIYPRTCMPLLLW